MRVKVGFEPLFACISDTHLNAHQYGMRQRAEDMCRAFEQCLSKARELLGPGGLVIHAGDVFNSPMVRPSAVLEAGRVISDSGMEVWAIRGNHDGSSLRASRRDLSLLLLEKVGPLRYVESDVLDLELGGKTFRFAMQSYCAGSELEELGRLLSVRYGDPVDFTVAVLHAIVEGVGHGAELGRKEFEDFVQGCGVDLALCGHHHEMAVDEDIRAIYPGSPECLDISKAGHSRGFFLVGLSGGALDRQWVPISPRPMRNLEVDLGEVDSGELQSRLEARLRGEKVPEGSVVRVVVKGRGKGRSSRLDKSAAASYFQGALKTFVVNRVEYEDRGNQQEGAEDLRSALEGSLLELAVPSDRASRISGVMEDILREAVDRKAGWISQVRDSLQEVISGD